MVSMMLAIVLLSLGWFPGLNAEGGARGTELPPRVRQDPSVHEERSTMSQVAKVITVIGNSTDGFAEAAQVAVAEAAKSLRGITGADVVSMSCEVDGDQITQYRTTVNIAFALER
jgi:dodecin